MRTSETGQCLLRQRLTSSLIPRVPHRVCSGRVQKLLSRVFLRFSKQLRRLSEAFQLGRAHLGPKQDLSLRRVLAGEGSCIAASAERVLHLIGDLWGCCLASLPGVCIRKRLKCGRRERDRVAFSAPLLAEVLVRTQLDFFAVERGFYLSSKACYQ